MPEESEKASTGGRRKAVIRAALFGSHDAKRAAAVILIKDPCAGTVFAFAGMADKVGMPLHEFAAVLDPLGLNVIFVKDLSNRAFLADLPGLGSTPQEAADVLLTMVPSGSRFVGGLGNSAGGLGALMLGTLMGAPKVIAFNPQTHVTDDDYRRRRLVDPTLRMPDALSFDGDCRNLLAHTACPLIDLHVGSRPKDLAQAHHLADLPSVRVISHPHVNEHNLALQLARERTLRGIVRDGLAELDRA